MRRATSLVVLACLLFAGTEGAALGDTTEPRLTEARAVELFLVRDSIADWAGHYPKMTLVTRAAFDGAYRDWTVTVGSARAGEIAAGRVDDTTGAVLEAWTGPQLQWTMARGSAGDFGGNAINRLGVWLGFCAVFLLGLADFRRPASLRNVDLLVLLSFSASLWYFNHGRIFTAVPLAYPPLLYLLARSVWIGWRNRGPAASRPVWPVWALAAVTMVLVGVRIGLTAADSKVIDVGYSGVIGAQRISSGQAPYGHMPTYGWIPRLQNLPPQARAIADKYVNGSVKPCAPADRYGEVFYRIQANGRCEGADPFGDTYGPVAYQAYLPGYWILGWKGKGDDLDAARFTSILFDLLCLAGLALVGRRFGGSRLAVTLAFAWAAYPFTQYVLSWNSNDSIQPAFLIWGLWLATSPRARGSLLALAGWTKFASLLLFPLWATYPETRWRPRTLRAFAGAFIAASLSVFWILLLEPDPVHAARVFWDRTIGYQLRRDSPFSIWDWRQYHAAGVPDLHALQILLAVLLVLGALAVAFVPLRKSPLQLAAFTAAVLIGVEIVMTHWSYLYLPWFLPFVAFAVLAPRPAHY